MLTWIKKEGLKEILIPKGWGTEFYAPLARGEREREREREKDERVDYLTGL